MTSALAITDVHKCHINNNKLMQLKCKQIILYLQIYYKYIISISQTADMSKTCYTYLILCFNCS